MVTPSKLTIPVGFSKVTTSGSGDKPRLIISVEALEKAGKTHFALTAPGPIAAFDMDTGFKEVVAAFVGKDIVSSTYHATANKAGDSSTNYEAMWAKIMREYKGALLHPRIRTIICDTATEMWEIARMAHFGKLTQVKPYHYAPVNAEFRELIHSVYDTDKNLILVHKQKQQYVTNKAGDSNWNGLYERAGFKDVGFLVQANLVLYYRDKEFHCLIKDCRQNMALSGETLSGPMCSFPMFASLLFPDYDWEKGE